MPAGSRRARQKRRTEELCYPERRNYQKSWARSLFRGGRPMPYVNVSVNEVIERKCREDQEFKELWESSREEYRLIGEMVRLRKEENITQNELAKMTGTRQQVISRIEKRENSPTLKNFCNILHALGYELQIVKKSAGR